MFFFHYVFIDLAWGDQDVAYNQYNNKITSIVNILYIYIDFNKDYISIVFKWARS